MSEITLTGGAAGASGRIILIPDEHILCDTPILLRSAAGMPDAIPEAWVNNILAHIDDKFIPGWAAVLASEETFVEHMAQPAADGYTTFLNATATTRRGLPALISTAKHAKRLKASYGRLQAAIEELTTLGRDDFEQRILDSEDTYRKAEALPLSLTGDYLESLLGAATRQWFFLGNPDKFGLWKWVTDYTEGDFPPDPPFLIDIPKWDIARRHANLLVQGGCFVLQHHSVATVEGYLAALLTENLNDAYAPPPESFITFQVIEGTMTIRTLIAFA